MDPTTLDRVLARQALDDLLSTYARAIDRGDEALLASVFFADAPVLTGLIDAVGADFARQIVAMVRGNLRSCFHSISNRYFEIAGDRAAGESYVIAHMISAGDAPDATLTGGRYLDRFERREGVWKIAHRRFVTDWTLTQPAAIDPGSGGYWAPDDPAITFWRESGVRSLPAAP